jgi:hypothetical protein
MIGARLAMRAGRVRELEAELAETRRLLAEARRTIDDLMQVALDGEAARDALVDNLITQVENLQANVDDDTLFIDRAGEEFELTLRESQAKDEHIASLQLALLRSPQRGRQ